MILNLSQLIPAMTPYYCVLNGEAANTNFRVSSLTRPGIKPTIYHTRGDHANYYAIDAVLEC